MAYTYASFRSYLENEILQETARVMGWNDEVGFVVTGTVQAPTISGAKTAQGVYDAITNEVLLQMNYSTPDVVPDADTLEMRSLGRIEAWRAVAFNTMGDTDMNLGDSTLLRSQVFAVAMNQIDLAEADYKARFGAPETSVGSPRAATYAVENEWRW